MSDTVLHQAAPAAGHPSFARWASQELQRNRVIYAFLLAFVTVTVVFATLHGQSFVPFLYKYLYRGGRALVLIGSGAVVFVAVQSLVMRHESPIRHIRTTLLNRKVRGFVTRYTFACCVLTVFMAAFLYNKTMIPAISPFAWDPVFIRWDRALLGGNDAWALLQPFFGTPAVTVVLDLVYSSWVPVVFVFWATLAASTRIPHELRVRYWLSTMLSWTIVGLVMATVFSSAGPCFLPGLFPDQAAAFSGLNGYLADLGSHVVLTSGLTKDYLWEIYTLGTDEPGGISAMPSMHNAQAVLFAAVAYKIDRRFGHAMVAYAVLIFLGSILLAWHYAVDGLIGATASMLIWMIAGRIVPRYLSRPEPAVAMGVADMAPALRQRSED